MGALSRLQSSSAAWIATGAALVYVLRRLCKPFRAPPGSLGLPLLGETLSFVMDPVEFVRRRQSKHGKIFTTHILFSPTVYLSQEHAKLLYKTPPVGWPSPWEELLGPCSMVTINGPRHKFQRSIASQAFTPKALTSYLPLLQEVTMKHLGLWASRPEGQGRTSVVQDIQLYTFEIAERALLGCSSGEAMQSLATTFTTWVKGFEGGLPFNLPWTAHGKAMQARTKLLNFYQQVIDEKRRTFAPDARDMLTLVMNERERGEQMSDAELKDFCLVIMFAGHDTTKCTISTMLHYLSAEPAVAEELREEVAGIWDGTAPITWAMVEALSEGGKCGRFIGEVLRIMPPVPAVYRTVTEDIEHGGFRIPKGWKLMTIPKSQHIYSSENMSIDLSIDHAKLKEEEYCPFGGGIRKCIGYRFARLELLVWLMCFLARFNADIDASESKMSAVPFFTYTVSASFSHKRAPYQA